VVYNKIINYLIYVISVVLPAKSRGLREAGDLIHVGKSRKAKKILMEATSCEAVSNFEDRNGFENIVTCPGLHE
jgi:hypothetical protein